MNPPKYIEVHGATDVGCVRSGNEDCFTIVQAGHDSEDLNPEERFQVNEGADLLLAVSDGMGGAAAGEIASSTALITLKEYVDNHFDDLKGANPEEIVAIIEEGVHTANRAIFTKSQETATRRGMGATITAGYLKEDVLYLFQIGDSRGYVLRNGTLSRITRDQSFVGHLVEMGTITEEQAMKHPQRNVILQALGTQEKLKVDVSYLPICQGDLIFICSDGLYGEFLPQHFEKLIQETGDMALEDLTNRWLEDAKKAGGKDNITVVAMRVHEGAPPSMPGERARYQPFNSLTRDNPVDRSGLLQ